MTFKISYRNDPRDAAARVEQVARTATSVLTMPAPKATLYKFTDAGDVTIRLQYYARLHRPVGGLDIRAEILTRLLDSVDDARIAIPMPLGEVMLSRSERRPTLGVPG